MTRPDLDAIEARVKAATAGPWRAVNEISSYDGAQTLDVAVEYRIENDPDVDSYSLLGEPQGGDVEFIAHARDDIPALLAYIAELERECDLLRRRWQHIQKAVVGYAETPEQMRQTAQDVEDDGWPLLANMLRGIALAQEEV